MLKYLFCKKINKKERGIFTLILVDIVIVCLIISFFAISTNADNNPSITLHHASHVHIVSTYYGNNKVNKHDDKILGNKVNHYLNRITNLNKYRVSVKPSPIGSNNDDEEDTLTETIQLNRK